MNGALKEMKYPVTAEALNESFKRINGCRMSDRQKQFWGYFADLINRAYREGIAAGKAESKISKWI